MTAITFTGPPVETNLLTLPSQDQLPCDDGEPMETQRHKMQMDLLIEGLDTWLDEREDGYVGGNMFIYFSQAQIKNQDFKGPDFFAVTGVSKKERKSWVVWEEEKAPDVVIELLSESTANHDKTLKKQIYQDKMRVSEYFWYNPFDSEDFAGFTLNNGLYQPLPLNEKGSYASQSLGLNLVRWSGTYRSVEAVWLRWATLEGEILPTGQELAKQAQQQAKQERLRGDRLEAQLRALGVEP
jgi:Uma2 family endonuclease